MLFNSYIFIFGYLPVTFVGFFLLAKASHRLAAIWLAATSLFFYGWWNPAFVLLIMASITINYAFGHIVVCLRTASECKSRMTLAGAIAINLGLLAYFKYANFFIANYSQLVGVELVGVNVVLPLGISFFTFTQIAFLVDAYRGIAREYNFVHYVLFVTYFPHLIAGPVLHHKQMMPQFGCPDTYSINRDNINAGLTIFILGLAKKVLIADQFALYADPVFDVVAQGGEPKLIEAWAGALAYTLQIYFDFSGYSDMAIGLSCLFNVKLPLNFHSPYKAPNIIEFWRRWHMTLSSFLRDYLYIPLGGSRKGAGRRYVNLMVTMLLGGLWHGAAWTFVIWGGLHGLYLMINHGWRRLTGFQGTPSGWATVAGIGLTFVAVVIAWIPFRAANLDVTLRMWTALSGLNGISLSPGLESRLMLWVGANVVFDGLAPLAGLNGIETICSICAGLSMIWLLPNTQQLMRRYHSASDTVNVSSRWTWQFSTKYALVGGILLAVSLLALTRESAFLYFQF